MSCRPGRLHWASLRRAARSHENKFALKHRYALVLHTDQRIRMFHLVVKATSEQGKRLNIRKETLREWRREFARHLRAKGIAANATTRSVRGVTKIHKSDGIYRACLPADQTHVQSRVESVVAALHAGKILVELARTGCWIPAGASLGLARTERCAARRR